MDGHTPVKVQTTQLTLSKLVFRHFGTRDPDLLERTIKANPSIYKSLFLPYGSTVWVPNIEPEKVQEAQTVLRLFD